MAIDIEKEQVLTLSEAAAYLPARNGRKVGIPTLWRWSRHGIRGVRLEYIRIGRNIATSREALGRFFHALAEADRRADELGAETPTPTPPRAAPRQAALRRASLAHADEVLARDGLMPAATPGR